MSPISRREFDDTVCAVVIEPIQGEGGIFLASEEFWQRARSLATQHDAALIADEIQSGLGRTGRPFRVPEVRLAAGYHYGRKTSCWRPSRWARSSQTRSSRPRCPPGMHGSTFGGGPLVCATALEFLNIVKEEGLLANKSEHGAELRAGLQKLGDEI